jgi:hypothetical protein
MTKRRQNFHGTKIAQSGTKTETCASHDLALHDKFFGYHSQKIDMG